MDENAPRISPSDGCKKSSIAHMVADPKKAKTKETLSAVLASSNPLTSNFWWSVKHPKYTPLVLVISLIFEVSFKVFRMLTCVFVLIVNLYVYLGDPASFSSAKSYATLVGDVYHGWFEPDTPGFLTLRLLIMVCLGMFGTWAGIRIQQHVLRDYFHLVLFGYDNGTNPDRDPIVDQDGAWFVVMCSVGMSWYVGLGIYGTLLIWFGVDESHWLDSGMHNWTFAGYNLILAGLFTYVCDWYAVVAVWDQMLQAIDQKEGTGYLAYEADWLQKLAAAYMPHRVLITRIMLLVGWPAPIIMMLVYFNEIKKVIQPEGYGLEYTTGASVGAQWAWSREWNTEHMRMLAASLVAFFNLCIVAQDWDFPDFSGEGTKIVALDLSAFHIKVPETMIRCLSSLPSTVYISAKWFNYFGIMLGVSFDWAYWFMTALCFRPCDYAQLWDSDTGLVYTLTDEYLQDRFAGHQSAKNCSWFTDNGVQTNFVTRSMADDPYVVRVDTGIFTGAYTIDEQDEYVFAGAPVVEMWLMCIPPLFGWVTLAYLIFSHERVTCFNYHKVIAWFDTHGDHTDNVHDHSMDEVDEDTNEAGSNDEDKKKHAARKQRKLAGFKRTVASAKAAKKRAMQVAAGTTSFFGKFCAPCTSADKEPAEAATSSPQDGGEAGGAGAAAGAAPKARKMKNETEMANTNI